MTGDPIVRQIVKKMYGPECESVVLYENQVIVSRETLATLLEVAGWYVDEYSIPLGVEAAIDEARGLLS